MTLSVSESHHAAVVLRVRVGDTVQLLDGVGGVGVGKVFGVTRKAVQVELSEWHQAPPRTSGIIVAAALSKARAWESMLQKATELDVAMIVPLITRRCVARVEASEAAARQASWQSIVAEATKQCGAPWMPCVEAPVAFASWIGRQQGFGLGLVASLAPEAREIGDVLDSGTGLDRVAILIGPEGDFEPAEMEAAMVAGFHPVTLGQTVLRTDTAALAAVSVVSHELRRRHR